jgi:uncharacterized protein
MEIRKIAIDKPVEMNFILGQTHFIKSIEDIHEAIVSTNPNMKFGVAFCEASGAALIRFTGNDDRLIEIAQRNAMNIGCGHSFIIFMENGFPINILNSIKNIPEVCNIFCATANSVEIIVAETEQGRGILGVVDGISPKGIEGDGDILHRKNFLRKIGYKL